MKTKEMSHSLKEILLYGTMKTNGQKCKTYLLMLLTESNILLNF